MSPSAPEGPAGADGVRDGDPEGPANAGAGREPDGGRQGVCELCGGPTYERHCKIVCLNCGYRRDCSDP